MLDVQCVGAGPEVTQRETKQIGSLRAAWSKRTAQVECTQVGEGTDAALLEHALAKRVLFRGDGRSLLQELERRGYDLSTLRFSIRKKEAA